MNADHYTYRVTWSPEDGEHVGLCAEFPSLSWLAGTPEAALKGIRRIVAQSVEDMRHSGEDIPQPLAEKHYSGQFRGADPAGSSSLACNPGRRAGGEPEPAGQREAGRLM